MLLSTQITADQELKNSAPRVFYKEHNCTGNWRLCLCWWNKCKEEHKNKTLRKQANCHKCDEICNFQFSDVKRFWKCTQAGFVQETPKVLSAIVVLLGGPLKEEDGALLLKTPCASEAGPRDPRVRTYLTASSLWTHSHGIRMNHARFWRRGAANSPQSDGIYEPAWNNNAGITLVTHIPWWWATAL